MNGIQLGVVTITILLILLVGVKYHYCQKLSKKLKEIRYNHRMIEDNKINKKVELLTQIMAVKRQLEVELLTQIMAVKRQLTKLRRERENLEVLIIDEEYELQTLTNKLNNLSME